MALLVDQPAIARRPAGVVRVGGDDRLGFLHTLLSQEFEQAAPGTVADFLYLDAKGNPRAAGRAVVRGDDVLLLTDPEVAPTLAEGLEAMKFMLDVAAADESDAWALASLRGADLPDVADVPETPMRAAESAGGVLVRDRSGGVDLLGAPQWLDERLAEVGLPESGDGEWERWRIGAGEPAWGREIAAGHRPQELGLLPTHVHLRKGCYPGQESIAKTFNLGRPRRALAVVAFDEPVEAGADLEADGRRGVVTSAVADGDGALALALVPVDRDGALPAAIDRPAGRILRRVGEGLAIPGA